MAWNVHLPTAEWYSPTPPSQGSGWERIISGGWKFDIEPLVREALDQQVISIDTETTGLNVVKDFPLFWSMAWGNRRMCMPVSTLSYFSEVFRKRNLRWLFANAKFDMHMLANAGVQIAGDVCDTAVMHALIHEESPHDLKSMSKQKLGWGWSGFKETFGISGNTPGLIGQTLLACEQSDLPRLVEYASNDAFGTLRLYEVLKEELEKARTFSLFPATFGTMGDIFFQTEMPYTRVLWKMERRGIKINKAYLQQISGPCEADLERIKKEIVRVAGRMLNPNSTPQLVQYFVKEKGLRPLTWTNGGKTGVKNPSVDASFLEYYRREEPMAQLILDFRELDKLKGTYIDGLQEKADHNDRIHTKFNQDVARTGRLSSSDPNLQNIPIPENDKFKLRGAFIADEDNDLIVIDYAALEMRLLAAASREPAMVQIFLDGKDIHMGNAEMVFGRKFGINYDDINKAKKIDKEVKEGKLPASAITQKVRDCLFARQAIKSIAFGLNYGMKEAKLGRDLNIPKADAKKLMDEYMDTYPAVKQFYAEAISETQKSGHSYTLIGRRRAHPAIFSSRDMDRWEEERKAVNNNIQGTAADVVRLAQLLIDSCGLEYKYGCNMLLQVHDELVFECPKSTSKEATAEIVQCMEHPFETDLDVPLTVAAGRGHSWLDAK